METDLKGFQELMAKLRSDGNNVLAQFKKTTEDWEKRPKKATQINFGGGVFDKSEKVIASLVKDKIFLEFENEKEAEIIFNKLKSR